MYAPIGSLKIRRHLALDVTRHANWCASLGADIGSVDSIHRHNCPPAGLNPDSSLGPRIVAPRTVVRRAGRNLYPDVAGFACCFPGFPG